MVLPIFAIREYRIRPAMALQRCFIGLEAGRQMPAPGFGTVCSTADVDVVMARFHDVDLDEGHFGPVTVRSGAGNLGHREALSANTSTCRGSRATLLMGLLRRRRWRR